MPLFDWYATANFPGALYYGYFRTKKIQSIQSKMP